MPFRCAHMRQFFGSAFLAAVSFAAMKAQMSQITVPHPLGARSRSAMAHMNAG